ncbi:uncharacterized protein Z518_08156 [Rhinocladiella mackenziei CBS 650.93]|uniref:Uncharacterized protein n=1 Tax=Rhinocladiella mackenziei CBS 650.93 TaxID=1442369 RepID=A0A0D2FJT2_9EURO|nr:uncharacterized protein Z518_08156 [Rhinocladiella mackenziei CBS 650.93]KIX02217.1 hypothetical protein Z518_08156 [Rhinocladiella mackenziei CBS 650.93]
MDNLAFKLTGLAGWKLQCESQLIDPDLPKLIGHFAVYQNAVHYVEGHDHNRLEDCTLDPDTGQGEVQDIDVDWTSDEEYQQHPFSGFLSHPEISYQQEECPSGIRQLVVVSENEIAEENQEEESDPFSDDEGYSSYEEGDEKHEDNWSDSSVEEDAEMEELQASSEPKHLHGSIPIPTPHI